MNNLRMHGRKPFNIAVVHGGPGARGEMYPVAREISLGIGVLEPLQTANSVEGQVEELRNILENYGNPPLILIGFSWGAWLSYILTAYHPLLVKKLILISSGPFEEKYATKIMETRLSHLSEAEKKEVLSLSSALNSNRLDDKSFARFGELMGKADSFAPLPQEPAVSEGGPDADIFQKVWTQASKLRSTGELLKLGVKIRCPVVAIHGDHDPHPAEGIKGPLSRVLKNFRFILLKQCGHHPWLELNARDDFYRALKKEIGFDTNRRVK
ncbi:MAG: alpha/beta hydrolase [Chloroflexi bacterium]|nr:alpha/beta hydrolase [Chloroflexota bacterium]MBM3173568.1 alpha/beta hydrolase [Chloroflexota bacterium]MBM4453437.1 alpha/beta hydrolase [Chloroflexota bacterium]